MVSEYGKFVKEAFIDPIRTVVVVDDDFPTLDALLDKEIKSSSRQWKADAVKTARDIITFCRERSRPWLVDIHDGQTSSLDQDDMTATCLQHSDLMILDYHLNPDNPSDGSRAISLLRRLADNDHFNLVVVYTRGDEQAGGDIDRVIKEIAVGLSTFDERVNLQDKSLAAAEDAIEKWMDDDDSITERLLDAVDEGAYLRVRQMHDEPNWREIFQRPEFSEFKDLVDSAPVAGKWKLILKWALHKRQANLAGRLSPTDYGLIKCHPNGEGVNWIRTQRLFITVVSKSHDPSTLSQKLLDALNDWIPQPHRLLMSKMRAEIDERGVLAEDEVLSNRCLQAGWLEDFLTGDEEERLWRVNNTFNRHWESLGDVMRHRVGDFTERLATYLSSFDSETAIKLYSPFKDDHEKRHDDVKEELNRYACSKPVDGIHLTTGHILKIISDGKSNEFWLCLSPACDLVPGQKSTGWHGRLGDHMPFTAVELFKCNRKTALENASNGTYLFLAVEDTPMVFSFTPSSQPGGGNRNEAIPNPKLEQFFAADKGKFSPPDSEISLSRITEDNGGLVAGISKANVVSQLRYEYALNLLQRLGATQTRVGVDFVSHVSPSTS